MIENYDNLAKVATRTIDINCDLGEGCPNDAELMPLISSANIACGAHAGDAETMRHTIDLALRNGVSIGAHPGYSDQKGFGRSEIELTPDEIIALVGEQIERLAVFCAEAGTTLRHVKPHGALYNLSARDAGVARAIATAVHRSSTDLVLFGLSGSISITEAEKLGLRTASEVFADRTYQMNGHLTPRFDPNALINDPAMAASQAITIATSGTVRSVDGVEIRVAADTICIHGDGPNAVAFAAEINKRLRANDIAIRPAYG